MDKLVIPFVDLHRQYNSIKFEIDTAIKNVITETEFIGGKYVKQFEQDFRNWNSIKNVVACANGTDSMEIILKAWNIGPGDEVIVPAMTWVSTAEAVSNLGATPVFVDVDEDYYTINPSLISSKISAKTRAIIPVHLYGQCADMPEIMRIAKQYNLKVLEDCAQAHGAMINDKMAGTWGDASSFSFYPGKNLGSYGDAGCIATDDDKLAELCRIIANHGQKSKHNHFMVGRNSRMDGIQGAILSAKLPFLNRWNEKRIKVAEYFKSNLNPEKYQLPKKRKNGKHVFHVYVLICKIDRNTVVNQLSNMGIASSIHYPSELPFTKPYFSEEVFENSRKLAQKSISIPIFAELYENELEYIVKVLNDIS
jgi:dTDP-4-amino-4,6-dideoxygalactose transaminase